MFAEATGKVAAANIIAELTGSVLPNRRAAGVAGDGLFHAPPPGTCYIICSVPAHAQQGMWATFIFR